MTVECVEAEGPTRWRTRGTSARLRVDLTGTVAPTPGGSHVRIATVLHPAPHMRPLAPLPRAAMARAGTTTSARSAADWSPAAHPEPAGGGVGIARRWWVERSGHAGRT